MQSACLLLFALLLSAFVAQGAQDLSYNDGGLNWGGLCETSKLQSPINLVPAQYISVNASSPASFAFGTGTNVTVSTASPHIITTGSAPAEGVSRKIAVEEKCTKPISF